MNNNVCVQTLLKKVKHNNIIKTKYKWVNKIRNMLYSYIENCD